MKFVRWTVFLIGFVSVVGCTDHAAPIHPNAPTRIVPAAIPVEVADAPESSLESANLQTWQKQFLSATDGLTQVLVPLSQRVLDPKRIANPASWISRAVQDELINFNHLLLQTPEATRKRPEFQQILKRYEESLSVDCAQYRDSCAAIQYFKTSSNSSQVLKLVAASNPDHYFKTLLFAVEVKNLIWDSDLLTMFFTPPQGNVSADEIPYHDSLNSMLESALHFAANKNVSTSDTAKFLTTIHVWDLLADQSRKFSSSTKDLLYQMIAQTRYMYDSNGQLTTDFKKVMAAYDATDSGFMTRQKSLTARPYFSAAAVGMTLINRSDELLYILDSVFTHQISQTSGVSLFQSTNRTSLQLEGAVLQYIQIEYMLALYESAEKFKEIFEHPVSLRELWYDARVSSSQISAIWNQFMNQVGDLKNFALLAAAARPDGDSAVADIRASFDTFQNSIQMMSVLPEEMILIHKVAQQSIELGIPRLDTNVSGKATVNSATELWTFFFDKGVPQPFDYAPSQKEPSQFQILQAFDFAMRTNIFALNNIEPDFFISDTVRRLTTPAEDEIQRTLSSIQAAMDQSNYLPEFLEACKELDGGHTHRTLYYSEVSASPIYGNLIDLTENDILSQQTFTGGTNPATGLFYLDFQYAGAVERARTNLGSALRIAQSMLTSYTFYLKSTGASDSIIQEKTKLTQAAIQHIQNRRQATLDTSKKWYSQIGTCSWRLNVHSNDVNTKALMMEEAYLRQVHRNLIAIRSGKSTVDQMNAKIAFQGLPSNFQGKDRYSQDGYSYNQIDMTIRATRYATRGLVTDVDNFPPLSTNVSYEYGPRMDSKVDAVQNSSQKFLAFVDDENQFVDTAIQALFKFSPAYQIKWLGTEITQQMWAWGPNIYGLMSLYHLDRELNGGKSSFFTPELILNHQDEILKMFRTSKELTSLMATMGVSTFFHTTDFTHRLMQGSSFDSELMGLYDFPITVSEQPELGWQFKDVDNNFHSDYAPTPMLDLDYSQAAKDYFVSRATDTRLKTILPYGNAIDRFLDTQVGNFVRVQLDGSQKFEDQLMAHIQANLSLPAAQQTYADLNAFQTIRTPVSSILISTYHSSMSDFHTKTGHCFESAKPCPQFKSDLPWDQRP